MRLSRWQRPTFPAAGAYCVNSLSCHKARAEQNALEACEAEAAWQSSSLHMMSAAAQEL